MGARFVGSARLGDRRRRRLAVESEDGTDQSLSDDAVQDLPSVPGSVRFLDLQRAGGTLNPQPFCDVSLPCTVIIPLPLWKHLLGAFLGYALAGVLIAAAVVDSARVCAEYWGLEQLVSLPQPRLATWLSSTLLILSAQLSILIRWGRARSLKDFDGQYRVWMKSSAALLLWAGALSTGAHHIWGKLAARLMNARFEYPDEWNWLAPALLLGLWLATALGREMQRCRASLVVFSGAILCYTVGASCLMPFWKPVGPSRSDAVVLAATLLGHVSLLFSLALHARHVLYFCADPTRSKKRKLRIPRPHFRWPQWARRRKSAVSGEVAQEAAERPRKRRRKAEAADGLPETPEIKPREERTRADSADSRRPETLTPARSGTATVAPHAPAASSPVPANRPAQPAVQKSEPQRPAQMSPSARSNSGDASRPAASSDDKYAIQRDDEPGAHSVDNDDDSADAETNEFSQQPDFRGMSKKQRRRLMQEMRDRERSHRR